MLNILNPFEKWRTQRGEVICPSYLLPECRRRTLFIPLLTKYFNCLSLIAEQHQVWQLGRFKSVLLLWEKGRQMLLEWIWHPRLDKESSALLEPTFDSGASHSCYSSSLWIRFQDIFSVLGCTFLSKFFMQMEQTQGKARNKALLYLLVSGTGAQDNWQFRGKCLIRCHWTMSVQIWMVIA